MDQRLYPIIEIRKPIIATMKIREIDGKLINSKKVQVKVHNYSLGGLQISSTLDFPLIEGKRLTLKLYLFPKVSVVGEIQWKEKNKTEFDYGIKIVSANLGYYKHYYSLQEDLYQINNRVKASTL